jgi:Lrp/AsnC family transcriptional regulator, leucine-responsive regulatory protein
MMIENGDDVLDSADFRILRALVEDGRATDVVLGDRINLSSTAAARRRRILEQQGYISGYSAEIDLKKLDFSITALILIELHSQAEPMLVEFEEAVMRCPSMSFCSFVSGEIDFVMLVSVRSFEDYDRVYRKELSTLPNVAKIRTSFLLRKVADRRIAPIVLNGLT